MTKEEAIKELSYIIDEMPSMECADWIEAISMGIKALNQEPCEDCISREFLLKCIETDFRTKKIPVPSYIIGIIKSAPPVNPTEKTARWVSMGDFECYCSNCHCWCYKRNKTRYCSYCGAKMEVEK